MFTMIECYILHNKLLKNGDKDMNKILIVDDNKQIVTILSEYAKKNNFIVDTAFDGEEAVIKAKSNNYDIMLLDVMMPKKDGYDVCKEIRAFSNLPIIMVITKFWRNYDKKIISTDIFNISKLYSFK